MTNDFFRQYDSCVEFAIILTIAASFVVGALTPRTGTRPWQGGFVLFTNPKEAIRIVHRIWATWSVEYFDRNTSILTQRFQVFEGAPPKRELKKFFE